MSIVTEAKLIGMADELLVLQGASREFRSGFIAGFYGIEDSCQMQKGTQCAKGVKVGKATREYFLGLRGPTNDALVEAEVLQIIDFDARERVPREVLAELPWARRLDPFERDVLSAC